MHTVEISNAAYKRLLSLRIGRESLSTVILREYPKGDYDDYDPELVDADTRRILASSTKRYRQEDVFR